jgi:Mediator complex subunit 27
MDDNKDFADVVKKFEEQNPDISVRVLGGGLEMALEVTMPDAAFGIAKDASQPKAAYMVSLKDEGSTPQRAKDVLGHIVAAHKQADLDSLLSLLASYKNLKTTLCNNCGKVFDDDLNFALVRKRKEGSAAEKNVSWVPLHANCAS